MSEIIEKEILKLFSEGRTVDSVCVSLLELLDSTSVKKSPENVNAISNFLLVSGNELKLINFVLENIKDKTFPIPWAHFLEALSPLSGHLSEATLDNLSNGIKDTEGEDLAARSQALINDLPLMNEWLINLNYKQEKEVLTKKQSMLDQLAFLRSQHMYVQEKALLVQMQGTYPNDPEVEKDYAEHKQRYALEILSRRKPRQKSLINEVLESLDAATKEQMDISTEMMRELAEQDPSLAFDFAVAAYMIDAYEEALGLLNLSPENENIIWFRLEVLLKCRRFVELLNEVSRAELIYSGDPETFFATAYLRAQALWGLGQKHTAKQVMEGLIEARPNYRAASTLLSIWSAP